MFSEILIPHISQVYWFIIVSLIPNVSQVYGFIVVMLIPNVSQVYGFIIVRLIPKFSQVYGFIVMRLITHVSAGPSRGGRSGPNSGLPDLALMKKVLPRLIPLPGGKNPIIAQWAPGRGGGAVEARRAAGATAGRRGAGPPGGPRQRPATS